MKQQIKIFTALFLALTTMPVLAETCPFDEINQTTVPGTHPNCDCSDTGGKGAVPAVSLGFNNQTHFISYNYQENKKINQCDEWIFLDAPCVHTGHSSSPKDYQTANIKQKGNCLVFGKQHKRKRIRELVAEYNKRYKGGTGSLDAGDGILIANTATVSDPVDLVDEWTAINKYSSKSGQPTIRGILWGYNKLCEKNGAGFELVRKNETDAVYYVCQEKQQTKTTPKAEVKPEVKTIQQTPINATGNSGNGNDANKCSDNSKYPNLGEILSKLGATPSIAGVDNKNSKVQYDSKYDECTGTQGAKNKWKQSCTAILKQFIDNKIDDTKKETFSPKVTENIDENGMTVLQCTLCGNPGYYYDSPTKQCRQTPSRNNNNSNATVSNGRAGTSNTLTQQTQNQQQQTINQSYLQELKDKLTAFPEFNRNIRYNVIYKGNVTTEQETWKNNCIKIISQIPGAKLENAPQIKEENGEVILTCVVTCEDPNAHIVDKQCKCNTGYRTADKGKCVVEQQEKEWKLEAGTIPELGTSIEVPQEHITDKEVDDWIKRAEGLIALKGGTNKIITVGPNANRRITYTCKITECDEAKGYKKQPVDEKTCVCDDAKGYVLKDDKCVKLERENLEKSDNKVTGVTVANGAKPRDVNISANTPTPTETDLNKSKCEDGKNGNWNPETKKCSCADGKEIDLDDNDDDDNDDAVCPTEKEMLYICEKSKNGFFDPETQKCSCADGNEIDLNGNDVCPEGTEEPAKETPAATKITYSGTVFDADTSEPLSYVHISQAGNKNGETTDPNGNFTYETTDPVVTVSHVSYKTITYTLQANINNFITLEPAEPQPVQEISSIGTMPEQIQKCSEAGGSWKKVSEGDDSTPAVYACVCTDPGKIYDEKTKTCRYQDDEFEKDIQKFITAYNKRICKEAQQ